MDDTTLQVVDGVISAKGLYIFGPIRITHDGGASQVIITTPALCEIDRAVVKCIEASATRTVNIDGLEIPMLLWPILRFLKQLTR